MKNNQFDADKMLAMSLGQQAGVTPAPYTPGPWRWNPTDAEIYPSAGRRAPVATVFTAIDAGSELSLNSDSFSAEENGNARLIAAAPSLLAALKGLFLTVNQLRKNSDDFCFRWRNEPLDPCDCAICQARAAIAAATGEQNGGAK